MYFAIKEVFAESDFTLCLTFVNGERKKFDMKPYLENGIFLELKDINKFKAVRVCFDTVEWENEADFDPEVLYNESVAIYTAIAGFPYFSAVYRLVIPNVSGLATACLNPQFCRIRVNSAPCGNAMTDSGRYV